MDGGLRLKNMHNKEAKKIIIIGLDGATFDIINPLIKRGELSNLARLIKDGVSGELISTIHPTTPQAWTTFMTGKGAGSHGIYDFIERVTEGHLDNLAGVAFDAGLTHVGRAGEVRSLELGLLNWYQTYGLKRFGYAIPFVGHGGTSLSTEEAMHEARGLIGKLNKATEPKRTVLQEQARFVWNDTPLIAANLLGAPLETTSEYMGNVVTKNTLDDTHHPKNTLFLPAYALVKLYQGYIRALGSENRTPQLMEKGIIGR